MVKLQALICSALFLLGGADLLTTVVGVTGKGAVEINPLLATLTQTDIVGFIGLKMVSVLLIGALFFGAAKIAKTSNINIVGKYFVPSASIACCLMMTVVVANNLLVIINIP